MINQEVKITMLTKKIIIKAPTLRSDLRDFSDAYIVVKRVIAVTDPGNAKRNKTFAFKSNAPLVNCISKINSVQIDNLDVVMPMYNLLEYRKKYREKTGSLWNYYRDEPSNPLSSNSESFNYKTSITGNTKTKIRTVVPLKHWSNF